MARISSREGRTGGLLVSASSQVQALADHDSAVCSCAIHYTLTMPLFRQVYKWVLSN